MEGANRLLDVAFAHPIKLVVNALGVPPDFMMEQARSNGVERVVLSLPSASRDEVLPILDQHAKLIA